jgi:hypothetical protein
MRSDLPLIALLCASALACGGGGGGSGAKDASGQGSPTDGAPAADGPRADASAAADGPAPAADAAPGPDAASSDVRSNDGPPAADAAAADAAAPDAPAPDAPAPDVASVPRCVPVADRQISEPAGASGRPSLAWTGDGYGLAWPDDRGGTAQVYFVRLDRAGARMAVEQPLTAGAAAGLPSLVWSGNGYGISWVTEAMAPGHVHFARLSAAGAVVGMPLEVAEGAGISSLTWTGKQYALAYHSARGGAGAQTDIFVSRFDAMGARAGGELQLTTDPAPSFIPSIAWTGSRFGVSFLDSRGGAGQVYLGLIDENGAEIGQEMAIAPGGAGILAGSPGGFALTYSGAAGAKLARLSLAGARTAEDVTIGGAPAPTVWTGSRYAFVWSDGGGPLYLATIDGTATAPSSRLPVSAPEAKSTVNGLSLAWIGDGYAVAWVDSRSGTAETRFAVVCPP